MRTKSSLPIPRQRGSGFEVTLPVRGRVERFFGKTAVEATARASTALRIRNKFKSRAPSR